MGIKNLMKVLNAKTPSAINEISISELKNKKIAIDTSIIIYQYVSAIRTHGDDLKSPDGNSTSHILGILTKTLNYLKMGIVPIHIFDGQPPELKMKILHDRSKIKKDAINKISELDLKAKDETMTQEMIEAMNIEKIKLLKQSVSISHKQMLEAQEIVKLLGVPYILAPEEADSQCAYLSRENLVDYVASEDMDLLTFGTKKILKNFMKQGQSSSMYSLDIASILNEGNITMDQFIDICILLGCDYTDTIEGIGMRKAWDLIVKYGSLEELISKEQKIINNIYKLPDNFRFIEAREYFKNPRHIMIESNDLELKVPKLNELKMLLIDKYGFTGKNIEHMIGFLRKQYKIADINIDVDIDDPFLDDLPKPKIKQIKKKKRIKILRSNH
jgi:flap endonuclease-1